MLLLAEFQQPENSFATQTETIWMEHEAIMCSAVVSRELLTSPDGTEQRVAN